MDEAYPEYQPEPTEGTVYGRSELLAGAASFGAKREVIAGAMALAGKSEMTRAEMEAAVAAFLQREA